jgi:RNA polymerase sigma-70 factor, ECF subfamily
VPPDLPLCPATELSLDPTDPYLRRLITCKVRKTIGKAGLTKSDLDDLAQDILLDIIQRLPSFDSRRSQHRTFFSRLVDHKLSNILRDRRTKRRDCSRCQSLNTPLVGNEDCDHADLLAADTHGVRTGCVRRTDEEQTDLAADIAQIVARMPPEVQDLCQRLQSQPLAAIAREVGIPRTTLQQSVSKIRRRFEDAGLREYL